MESFTFNKLMWSANIQYNKHLNLEQNHYVEKKRSFLSFKAYIVNDKRLDMDLSILIQQQLIF